MFCHQCGKHNPNKSSFCRYCGTKIENLRENKDKVAESSPKNESNSRDSVDTDSVMQTRGCQLCYSLAPTTYVEFYQNIGMLLARQYCSVKGRLCKECINREFKKKTLTTLFLGWWGTISFIITPFILLNNIFRFLLTIGMEKE